MQVYGEDATEGRAGNVSRGMCRSWITKRVRRGMTLGGREFHRAGEAWPRRSCESLSSIKGKIEDYLEVQLPRRHRVISAHLAMLENTVMTAGQKQFVQLRLAAPLPLVPGEKFVVRANIAGSGLSGLTTIGGGQILGLSTARLRRKKQWTLDVLAARREAVNNPLRWCEQMTRESQSPATVASLRKQCWSRAEEITDALGRLLAEKRVARTSGGGWIHRDVIQKSAENILAAVGKFHADNPQRAGISREELLTGLKLDSGFLDAAAESLLQAKQLERSGGAAGAGGLERAADGSRSGFVRPDRGAVAASGLVAAGFGGVGRRVGRAAPTRCRAGALALGARRGYPHG